MMTKKHMPVKNKAPSPIQITAEQLLRESRASQIERFPIKHQITDEAELNDHRLRKRKAFESSVRINSNTSNWVKYANWEELHKDFDRVRSVYERAVQVHYRDHTLWIKYAKFEMRSRFVNHARNVFDRAVDLLPRVDQVWSNYVEMEEMLNNFAGARGIFERWTDWMSAQGWIMYVKFEMRCKEVERARAIFRRFVECYPKEAGVWMMFAEFEMENGDAERARRCYESGVRSLGEDADDLEELFVAFAEFEEKTEGIGSARRMYKYALDYLRPKGRGEELYKKYVAFEKQHGEREDIDDSVVGKRRVEYEDEVTRNPLYYDVWFDYIKLEEIAGDRSKIEALYLRAIACVPPVQEKTYWRRYIYFWINYALYLEVDAQDVERARDVYSLCLQKIPHRKFSFAKIWLLAAQFEIRQLNIDHARKILGSAIGRAPKDKIFSEYIKIELHLGNIERCRKLYEKYIEWSPEKCNTWRKYGELERSLGETERARAIFELAVDQPALDMPELVWKSYIDFEISEGEHDRSRALYERLLNRTQYLNVWISYAKFEASSVLQESDSEQKKQCLKQARGIFERALCYFRTSKPELKVERLILLEEWLNMERSFGKLGDVHSIRTMLPRKLKKRRRSAETEDGCVEEYIDYIFPEETQTSNLAILEAAYLWKRQKNDD